MGKKNRLFQRNKIWHADLRDLGGGRPTTGCEDFDEALTWLQRRIIELKSPKTGRLAAPGTHLEVFAEYHLKAKLVNRRVSTVKRDELSLSTFLNWAPNRIALDAVDAELLNRYSRHRQEKDGAAAQTILHELHALSSLYKRAVAEGYVVQNPIALMVDKPRVTRSEAVWLEPHEAAAFLAEFEGDLHTLIAIALLTGGRSLEVRGLETRDVDFERGLVQYRPNKWRELKAGPSRSVKLWPQLREILEARDLKPGLLVPNASGEVYPPSYKKITTTAEDAGIKKQVGWNTLRHTYASLRLQTLDNGAPISPFNVARELGHSSLKMIFEHYGHVLESPQRLDVVEYRIARGGGGLSYGFLQPQRPEQS